MFDVCAHKYRLTTRRARFLEIRRGKHEGLIVSRSDWRVVKDVKRYMYMKEKE